MAERLQKAEAALAAAQAEANASGLVGEAAVQARVKYELLAEAKKRNLDLDAKSAKTGNTLRSEIDAQAASIARLTVEADRYTEKAKFMEGLNKSLQDGFLDAIVSGKDFGGVLEDLARQLAKAALQAALFGTGPFAGAGGGGGGLLGGLLGGLFSFEGGGSTGAGPRSGGMDGKGGYLAMVHPQETIIDNHKGGSGRGDLAVRVFVDDDGRLQAFVDRRANFAAMTHSAAAMRTSRANLPGAISEIQTRGG
jgi:hypothetical protein